MFQVKPKQIKHLSGEDIVLWQIDGHWQFFRLHDRWDDGALVQSLHKENTSHKCFLKDSQWVGVVLFKERIRNHRIDKREVLSVLCESWSSTTFPMRGLGTSMLPSIPPGVELILEPYREPLLPGQIIVWARDGEWISHRVRYIFQEPFSSTKVITRGDACLQDDPMISTSRILGRVVCVQTEQQNWHPDSFSARKIAQIYRLFAPTHQSYRRFKSRLRALMPL